MMAATAAVINKFTTITKPDCAENHITHSTHTVASITITTESKNRVGTTVEEQSTPPRVQNDAPEPLGGQKGPRTNRTRKSMPSQPIEIVFIRFEF